jgi:vacuolar-type H+-ATPase subunit H
LIDQLTETLNRGWRIPLTGLSVIDSSVVTHLLERMRINVPSAIMESERTLAERDLLINEARAEAERILQDARQHAAALLSEQALVQAAQQEAERIVEEGRAAARRRAEEADHYAMQVLEDLAQKLQHISGQVENGVQVMRNSRTNAAAPGADAHS